MEAKCHVTNITILNINRRLRTRACDRQYRGSDVARSILTLWWFNVEDEHDNDL